MSPFGRWRRLRRRLRRLWRLGDPGDSIDLEELKELAERSPTKKYVNLLLLVMAKNDVREVVLRSSRPLPPLRINREEEIPAFQSVVNRLKVMAALDPVIYHQPKEGKIELTIGASDTVIHLRFEDTAPDRCVHLRLEWLDEPVPPSRLA